MRTTHVMLATADKEFGLEPAKTAKARAQELANEQQAPVTLRDPTTDKVQTTVKPNVHSAALALKATKGKSTGKAAKSAKTSKATKPVKPAKAAKAPKPAAKAKAAKPAKANGKGNGKTKQPRGMVVEILKLASRPHKGVSPAELNELTKWKGAPWKWLFQNPKKNGYCDRWGYSFQVFRTEDGGVRYLVAKR